MTKFWFQETFLLGIGALLFFGVGCMVITAFDNVPDSLVDNAIILGILSIITGFIFLIDIGCFKRRQRDKSIRRDKEFRMSGSRDVTDAPAPVQQQVTIVEKSEPKQNGVSKTDAKQDEIISELRSSMKKKRDKSAPADEPVHQRENERVQTSENHIQQRRYSGSRSTPKSRHREEHDNSYDYDQQSIKNYDSDGSDDSEPYQYDRRSRGSQTSRKHFQKTVEKVILRDAETSTDTPTMVKTTTTVHYKIQSPAISTTDPHKSDSPVTSEEGYELHPPASSSYLVSNGKKFQPVITPSRIERLAQNAHSLNKDLQHHSSPPSSPQDPGYVLHTASKWPNTTPLAPQPYRKVKEEIVLRPVHSAV